MRKYLAIAIVLILAVCVPAHAAEWKSLQRGLVGSWEFRQDRTDGPTYYDLSAYGNDASFNDATELVTGDDSDFDTVGNWNGGNSATVSSEAGGQAGNCLKILENGEGNPFASLSMTAVVGEKFEIAVYISDGADNGIYRLQVGTTAAAGASGRDLLYETLTPTASWVQHRFQFTATATTIYINLVNGCNAASGKDTLWDTLTVQSIGVPTTDSHGNSNRALDLDGTDDHLVIADDDSLSFGDGSTDKPFTIAARVKMDDATKFYFFSHGEADGNPREYALFTNATDFLYFQVYDDTSSDTIGRRYGPLTSYEGSTITVIATYDGSAASTGIDIYIDGAVKDDTDNNAGSYVAMDNSAVDVTIGRWMHDGTDYSNGSIEFARVWSRVLTAAEIDLVSNHYFSGVSR